MLQDVKEENRKKISESIKNEGNVQYRAGNFRRAAELYTRLQCYKTFNDRNLRVFVISLSVCPWQALHTIRLLEKLAWVNQSSLLRKSINDGQKKFYNIDARCQCYKTFNDH